MVVGFNRKLDEISGKQIIHYDYTNLSAKPYLLEPSKETYLSYEIHNNIPDAVALIHFHHQNILFASWRLPLYGIDKIPDCFFMQNPVPGINARDIALYELTKTLVDKFRGNSNCVLGLRHGAWVISNNLKNALVEANKVDERAGRQRAEFYEEIFNYISQEFQKLKEDWHNN